MNAKLGIKSPLYQLTCGPSEVTSETPPTTGKAGCLQGQDRSAVTHPSSIHARRCTRYTAPLL
ncbi:hypothetical protein J6590_089002 [Homalodisca vitripennis]|nr:hypothetical protein J6590_089002 [Homalodisca vitripennis]